MRRVSHSPLLLLVLVSAAALILVQCNSGGNSPTAPEEPSTSSVPSPSSSQGPAPSGDPGGDSVGDDPSGGGSGGSDPAGGAQPLVAAIDIEKSTNGEDADAPPGPSIPEGAPVTWTYVVENTGDEDLTDATIVDDRLGSICIAAFLGPGDVVTCTATGTAQAGQYANLGTVTATDPAGNPVSDSDPSHYFGGTQGMPAIDIEKATNGEDADAPPGPSILVGDPVDWTYAVTNTGDVELTDVSVVDDQGVAVTCPQSTLAPSESMTCTASGVAVAGQYANVGTASGTDAAGDTVEDSDPSHYLGIEPLDCSAAMPSQDLLWPPNHKWKSIDVLGVVDPQGGQVTITIDSIFQDEPVNGTGDGDTAPDGAGVGTSTAEVRSERAGSGNGRFYHIGFTADAGGGNSCSGEVLVAVPKSQGHPAVDDGPLYDSTMIP